MSAVEQFRAAIAAAGLTPPETILTGKIQRFSTNGKRGDDAGWLIFHDDERPAGRFGCNRSGIDVTWRADVKREFSPEERKAWAERMRALEAEREAERKRATEQAAEKATRMWEAATDALDRAHPYLARKQIPGIGARILRDQLLIPMRQKAGQLCGLQVIQADGSRKFLTGTPAGGAYTVLGRPSKTGTVVICEGYATGVSIHQATGFCTVVAFSSGNLAAVAKKIAQAMPEAQLVIGADDDRWIEEQLANWIQVNDAEGAEVERGVDRWGFPFINVRHGAKQAHFKNAGMVAAAESGLPVAIPLWAGERGNGTDFNDLHLAEGLEAVRACFEDPQPILPEPEPQDDGAPFDDTPPADDFPLAHDDDHQVAHPVDASALYGEWLPVCTDKGKPLSTIENVAEICRRLGVVVRYNVISKEEELLIPGAGFSVDNRQNASLAWLISECAKFRMPVDRVPDFVTFLADRNLYNPVANWITSRPWDGEDRLSQLVATVHAKGEDRQAGVAAMKRTFITRWMISAVAAAFRPNGVSAHGVLVFQGDQYIGKTKWFKTLVPEDLGVIKDGVILRPDDRDSVMKCVSNWLVELGEIDATFRKSDVAALKSFLTSDRDVLRRAYARKESAFARRTVFFASVNPKNYLHDETGNRRYWTIECERLDHDHQLDMQQVWAQVHFLWQAGESWFLTPDEMAMLNEHNRDFEVIDPIEDLITNGLRWESPEIEWSWRTATEVLVALGRQNCSKSDVTRAGFIIRRLNGDQCKRSGAARMLRVPDCHSAR